MAEPLRRRVRARALDGLTAVGPWLPRPLLDAPLAAAAALARRGRLGARARANLELALGAELDGKARERLLRDIFRHGRRQVHEWLRLARSDGAWVERTVELDASVERLDEAVSAGRGVLVATAHLGNRERLAARLSHRGYGGAVIGRQHPRNASAGWLPRVRRAHGVETLSQDAPPRRALEVLRRGEVLGVLCDLEVRRLDGEYVPFFGHSALTIAAPASLARATRLPLMPVRCVATGPHTYRLSVEEPLHLDRSLERSEARRDLLTRLNACFEAWIREDPAQWAWHQHRWRTRSGEREVMPLEERRRRDIEALGYDPRTE